MVKVLTWVVCAYILMVVVSLTDSGTVEWVLHFISNACSRVFRISTEGGGKNCRKFSNDLFIVITV